MAALRRSTANLAALTVNSEVPRVVKKAGSAESGNVILLRFGDFLLFRIIYIGDLTSTGGASRKWRRLQLNWEACASELLMFCRFGHCETQPLSGR